MRHALIPVLTAVLVTALAVSACGRKGPLERPTEVTSAGGEPVKSSSSSRPDRPFILDRVLR